MLEMRGVSRAFAGVQALRDVNFTVEGGGQIHALVGENGAGKSTLMRCSAGSIPHGSYEGTIVFEAESGAFAISRFRGARDHHHPSGAGADPAMSIAENIFLSHPRRGSALSTVASVRRTRDLLAQVVCRIAGHADHRSRRREAQLVEIAKALSKRVRV